MDRITVGLDFGTHQTKVCIENKSDANNPEYSFFPFKNLEGRNCYILPSIVQVNKDNTLCYGFVNSKNAKYGKKFYVREIPKFPQRITARKNTMLPMPSNQQILSTEASSEASALAHYKLAKRKEQMTEVESAYQAELKEWYRWQNLSQINYRLIYKVSIPSWPFNKIQKEVKPFCGTLPLFISLCS